MNDEVIAKPASYEELIEALIGRMNFLELTCASIDELALLPDGYTGKSFGAAHVKNLGPTSLEGMLDVMCADMILVSNSEKLARLEERRKRLRFAGKRRKPASNAVRTAPLGKNVLKRVRPAVMRQMNARSRDTYRHVTSPEVRSRVARQAAEARWKGRRRKRAARAAKSVRCAT